MLIIPSFEGEKSVSLYGPDPEEVLTVAVAEADRNLWSSSFEDFQRSSASLAELFDRPIEAEVKRWEAPLDAATGMKIVDAFGAALRQARFPENEPFLVDPTVYEFTGLLIGFGEACARLENPRGSAPEHDLYRLATAMERYAKAPPDGRAEGVARLRELAKQIAQP